MGIYTERDIGKWSAAAFVAAAFAVLYGIRVVGAGELELLPSEVVYAATASEFSLRTPLLVHLHGWATPECFPLFPLAARLLRDLLPALPMESVLRGLSILMLGAGAVMVYFAASSRRAPTAGLVAAAMYSTSFLALGTATEGTPATTNAFLLSAAQLVFFLYGVRRSDWDRAWIFSGLLVAIGFLSGGFTVLLFFVFPMLFFRRPLSVSSKFRRPGFAVAVAVVALTALAWGGAFTSEPRQISPYDVWWIQLSEVRLGWGLLAFPFTLVFWLLPWSVIAWMPFCVALQTLDSTPIYSRYLRTLVFSTLALLWLLPEMGRFGLFYALAPLSVLTGRTYELGMRRYGGKMRDFLVVADWFMLAVPAVIAIGCFLDGELLCRFVSLKLTLNFREAWSFKAGSTVLLLAAVLLAFYVCRWRRSDPVWAVLLAVSVASMLFWNGLNFPYKAQDHSKQEFGEAIRAAMGNGSAERIVYTRNIRNLTGELFYAGFPVCRLIAADELPAGKTEVYLLSRDFPQSAAYSWENLLPKDYSYRERPLKLWKGTPSRAAAGNGESSPAPGPAAPDDSNNVKTEKNRS